MYKLQNFTWICIWQVLPDNKCCQMWLILWLFENICGCWQKQKPRKENFSKQKLHFHHRWKCSKNLDFQATFWQSLAGPYFCRFLSILSHIWTELSFVAKIKKTTSWGNPTMKEGQVRPTSNSKYVPWNYKKLSNNFLPMLTWTYCLQIFGLFLL